MDIEIKQKEIIEKWENYQKSHLEFIQCVMHYPSDLKVFEVIIPKGDWNKSAIQLIVDMLFYWDKPYNIRLDTELNSLICRLRGLLVIYENQND